MNVQNIAENFSVSEQVRAEDISAIADAGFKVVICNRPDGEEPGQPTAGEISAACKSQNLSFHHLPFQGADLSAGTIDSFREILDEAEGPVFAYCRSGQRSAYIWSNAIRPPGAS